MAVRTREETGSRQPEGRLAPIFLSGEQQFQEDKLLDHSRAFYERHKEILQKDFGVVSGLWQLDDEGERTEPPRETIIFDARQAVSKGTYAWELCYGAEPGVQEIVRLEVYDGGAEGRFAKTSNQGRFLPWASFELNPEEICSVENRLLQRLGSPEVAEEIESVYEARKTTRASIVRLINKQAAEDRVFALWLKVNKPPESRMFTEQIEAQRRNLETLGFAALFLFRPEWLEE